LRRHAPIDRPTPAPLEKPMGQRELAKAERRRRIIAAARDLIRETGNAGLSMRALAQRAGVSLATPYNLLGSKRAIFDLLTDDAVTAKFPAAERRAIKDFVPWTRLVQAAKTTYKNHKVDLPDFVMKHRTKLVLKPNDDNAELSTVYGARTDDLGWEKALRQAMGTVLDAPSSRYWSDRQ